MSLEARAKAAAERVVGMTATVHTVHKQTYRGKIVAARFSGVRRTPRSMIAQFELKMENAGSSALFPIIVEKLPRPQPALPFRITPDLFRSNFPVPVPPIPFPARLPVVPVSKHPVEGEYIMVGRLSRRRDLLEKAHATPISPFEARELFELLCLEYKQWLVQLRFSSSRGRACSPRTGTPWISLPRAMMEPGGNRYGKLRVGLVLHEFAHILTPRHNHDQVFIAKLDELLEVYYGKEKTNACQSTV